MAPDIRKANEAMRAVMQLLVLAFCAAAMGSYIVSIPGYYDALVTKCIAQGCGTLVPSMPIPEQGLSLEHYALLFVLIDSGFTFVFYATSSIMLWKGFREPMGLLAAAAMVSFGTSFPSLAMTASEGSAFAQQWFMFVSMTGWISLSLFFFLFPDGRFVPRWTRFAFLFIVLVDAAQWFFRGEMWGALRIPEFVRLLWYVGSTAILIYSQVYRFRKVSRPVQRQQTKWVVYGVTIGFVGFVGMSVLFDPSLNDGSAATYVALNAILNASLTAIPITLMMAVLRQRLWNIDPLVNRTLLYAALSVCVVLLYAFAVLYLGQLFRAEDRFVVNLLATVTVAVAFAPLKDWLQRHINRLMKGRHDDPYAVLLELGDQLIRPLAPEAMLDAVVRTVKDALRLPYAGIAIGIGGQDKMVASAGEPANELHSFPILHRGGELGTLYIASRSPGEAFTPEDGKFLDVLLRQAGPIVENVNMTLGMKLLANDLQESREKLVLAREEERRRIRKNLHDDLAPRLAALALNAATAQKYVEKEPATAIEMLTDLRQVIRSTVSEIRTMVHDLRPPALDELGLLGAIRERIHELAKPARLLAAEQEGEPLRIELQAPAPLPALPAAVEVAAYRIVVEAVVNVIKHAQATVCEVRLDVRDANRLVVEITDDGTGSVVRTASSAGGKGGIGLQSIRERAAELGGHCTIERGEDGGTRVYASLPLSESTVAKGG
ncbi:sensor histidine kinase [Paenibacillus sp.]|uniref:sensor histidine kinase n=1 Tax=Paenibacillus sp. TaxID=58172 RepID=UPI002D633DF8|nr:histidine kinase [Paenibacillus sp.]HZG84302.1 histidine kinase [Paenibacillus sp.]